MKLQIISMEVIMEDYILLDEDFKNFDLATVEEFYPLVCEFINLIRERIVSNKLD